MVDRKSRRALAALLRHLVAGLITNDEFERRCPRESADKAVRQIIDEGAWFLYDDLHEHRLTGKRRLSFGERRSVGRWILFLQSEWEYEWPVLPLAIRVALLPANLVTFGIAGRAVQRCNSRGGDAEVWPFRCRAHYEAALKEPQYLGAAAVRPKRRTQ